MCTGTPLKCTGTLGQIVDKWGFNLKFCGLWYSKTLLLSTNPNPIFFALSHKHPRVCLPLPGFPSSRPRFFFGTHRTDVVSLLQILTRIFGLLIVIHGSVLLDLGGAVIYLVVGSFS